MGLLDQFFQSPESQQGLLAASAALMQAGGPSRMPVGLGQALGQAMTAGQGSYQDAIKQKMLKEKMAQDKLMQDLQLAQMKQQQEAAQRKLSEDARRQQMIDGMFGSQGQSPEAPGEGLGMTPYSNPGTGMNPQNVAHLAAIGGPNLSAMLPKPREPKTHVVGGNLVDDSGNVRFTAPEKPQKQDLGALVIEGPDGKPMINPIALEARRKIAEAGRAPRMPSPVAPMIEGGEDQAAWTKRFGKAPPGFRWKADGGQERIPGGPADIKATAADERVAKQQAMLSGQAHDVLDTVKEAKALVGWDTAGPAGLLSFLPMSDARKLAGHVDTIKANLGFDRLQQMRDMSPTGGALGQVAVQEINYLQSTVRKLDQLQKPKDIIEALDKIEQHYSRWMKTLSGEAQPGSPTPNNQDAAALEWANKNPNDPRAAAIKAKLGAK